MENPAASTKPWVGSPTGWGSVPVTLSAWEVEAGESSHQASISTKAYRVGNARVRLKNRSFYVILGLKTAAEGDCPGDPKRFRSLPVGLGLSREGWMDLKLRGP